MTRVGGMRVLVASAALLGMLAVSSSAAVVPPVEHVAFAPVPGASLPLDARFVDEHGTNVRLGDYVSQRPAIVVPAYFGCSNLCGVVLNGVAAALQSSGLHPGRDVDVVVFSIDPLETPSVAMLKKHAVLGANGGDEAGWHFLTGATDEIGRVTEALGYRYLYVPAERQYAHGAGIAIVGTDGRIAGVEYGVEFAPAALRNAVGDAARGQTVEPPRTAVAGVAERWLLCFHYDPHTGRYSFAAMSAARAAGLAALLGLAGYVAFARRRERRHQRDAKP